MKTIILKNNTTSQIKLDDLGVRIDVGEETTLNWEDVLGLEDSTQLSNLIDDGSIILNDGSNDLSSPDAKEYISLDTDLSGYYNKIQADDLLAGKAPLVHDHDNLYYTKNQVDVAMAGIESYGIKGAVDLIGDLPVTGNAGEIYIVRGTSGDGNNDKQYVVNDDTILCCRFNDTFDDEIGNAMTHSPEYNFSIGRNGDALELTDELDTYGKYTPTVKPFNPGELSGGLWLYVDIPDTDGYDHYNPLIHFWDKRPKDGFYLLLDRGKVRFWVGTENDNRDPRTDIKVPVRTWTHIGFSYSNTTQRVRIFINGIISKEETVTCGGTIVAQNHMYIGFNPQQNHGPEDNMLFDEVFLQEGELTESEFQTIINGSPYNTINDSGFYTWDTDHWTWLADNGSGGSSGSTNISNADAAELTGGETTDLHNHDDIYYRQTDLFTKDELNNGQLDNRYYTEAEINGGLLDRRYYTESEIDDKLSNIKYSDISNNDTSTNVTGAELETLTNGSNADGLHTHANSGGGGTGGLDEAYDNHSQYNQGQGRTINVDFGSVEFNASAGFAPIKLPPLGYTPNQWLAGGELCIRDGELYLYDATRSSWTSVSGYTIGGGYNSSNVKNRYLRMFNGSSMSSRVGWCAPWDGVIVSMSIVSDCNGSSNSIIVKNNGSNTSAEVYYNNEYNNSVSNLNVQFSKDDVLSFYMNGNDNGASRPQVWTIVKRRIS